MTRNSTPRILMKSKRYPTYQLYAVAGNTKECADNQIVISALSVLEWLRKKFKEIEIPDAFQAPTADKFADVTLNDLKSAHIDCGYSVETVCIPEEKIWAFRLIEPDLGTKWEGGVEVSTAIPGRLFETNIAFRVIDNRMHMGVEIIVSEPEDTAKEKQAIVLRPAVVSELVNNPRLSLTSGYPIKKQIIDLNTKDRVKQLKDYLKRGMLPAVIFCDFALETSSVMQPIPSIEKFQSKMQADFYKILQMPNSQRQIVSTQSEMLQRTPEEPYDMELFAQSRLAYVHTFHLPADQFTAFKNILQIDARCGDILFLEPYEFGAGVLRYSYANSKKEKNFRDLMAESRDYLKQKPVKFGNVVFLSTAKLMLAEQYKKANMSVDDTVRHYEELIQCLSDRHKDELMDRNDKIQQQAAKITRLKNQMDELYGKLEDTKQKTEIQVLNAQKKVDSLLEKVEYLESLAKRPNTPQEIPAWVEERFSGRLILHTRAVHLIEAVSASDIDMHLLCDAIEYLATEYRGLKTGELQWDEVQNKCSEKYGRPFEVTGCGDTSIEMYSNQYKVKYKIGFKGKAVETPLDEHLKVGNSAGNLIRIYFFYDDEKKIIVVGSLPHHLKVAQIQA